MKRRIIAGIAIATFCAGQVSFAANGAEGCVAHSVSGQALQKSGDGSWTGVQSGPVSAGSVLRTGEGGLTLAFDNGNLVRVAPNSEVVVGESRGAEVLLHRGRVMTRATSPVEIHTTGSTTTAEEGEFVVSTDAAGASLSVIEGRARMTGLDGSKPEFPLAGELPSGVDGASLALAYAATEQHVPTADSSTPSVPRKVSKKTSTSSTTASAGGSGFSLFPALGGSFGAGLLAILAGGGGDSSGSVSGETFAGATIQDVDAAIYSPNSILRRDACCSAHN